MHDLHKERCIGWLPPKLAGLTVVHVLNLLPPRISHPPHQCFTASQLTRRTAFPLPTTGNMLLVGVRRMLRTVRTMRASMPSLLQLLLGRTLVWITSGTLLLTAVLFLEREFSMQADGAH